MQSLYIVDNMGCWSVKRTRWVMDVQKKLMVKNKLVLIRILITLYFDNPLQKYSHALRTKEI